MQYMIDFCVFPPTCKGFVIGFEDGFLDGTQALEWFSRRELDSEGIEDFIGDING